jgi:hypothetical protein
MRLRRTLLLILLIYDLVTFGCAGMNNYQPGQDGFTTLESCNGDVPSPYPPYCRPVHN